MKASIIACSLALFSSTIASPLIAARQAAEPSLFTISVVNDVSGRSATTSVFINRDPVTLGALFAGWAEAITVDGRIIATSAMNVNPSVQNVFCIFTSPAGAVFRINGQTTNAELDGVPGKPVPTDVTDFTIECQR